MTQSLLIKAAGVALIVSWLTIVAFGGIFVWIFVENLILPEKTCAVLLRHAGSSSYATGTLKREISGRSFCEVTQ